MPVRVNPLALFAVALGIGSVVTNWAHAGSAPWLFGSATGALAGIGGWVYPRRIGATLGMAAAALAVASIIFGDPVAPPLALALTSGACAGVLAALAGLFAYWLVKRARPC